MATIGVGAQINQSARAWSMGAMATIGVAMPVKFSQSCVVAEVESRREFRFCP
jgi:hypothetical protein